MHVKILGAGAGGGLPQWNCACRNCTDARSGRLPPMTQSSVAVSLDGASWAVLNASPDIREQLARSPELAPPSLRGTPIKAVVITNADVDHVAGLLTLREKTGFTLHASSATLEVLAANSVFAVLDQQLVARLPFALETPFEPLPGLTVTAFAVPGKVALYLEGETVDTKLMGEQTVGLILEGNGRRVAHVPGCAEVTDALLDRLRDMDMILFDGTVWTDSEMQGTGTGTKTGSRMGHVAMSGPDGSIARMAGLTRPRKVHVHVNNTNPAIQPDSPERAELEAAGWTLGQDGMDLTP